MKERYLDSLQRVIYRIEKSLPGAVHLDELSAEAGLSKYHLHRVFRSLTGYPLADYARSRRLSESLGALLHKEYSILDIALEFGFSHEQSYIRAFKHKWGVSPGEYRSRKLLLPITPGISLSSLVSVGDDSALVLPGLVMRQSLHLCGVRRFITDSDNSQYNSVASTAREFMSDILPTITHRVYADRYFGFVEHCPDPNDNWYMASTELRRGPVKKRQTNIEYRSISARMYHEFLLVARTHPANLLWQDVECLYGMIFDTWVKDNRDRLEPGWHLEFIDVSVAHDDYSEFRILIPAR